MNLSVASETEKKIWNILEQIFDPEIPVLSIVDLGIIRKVEFKNNIPIITITPTYSGCPAMDVIKMSIRFKLIEEGYKDFQLETILSPAWNTDWMSEKGKQQLKAFGIAPPNSSQTVCTPELFQQEEVVQCPRCNSYHTRMISRFGSTACKALYKCMDCLEPFDYFKCH